MKKIFIHTNDKQSVGAVLAKYAIERLLPQNSDITVEYINVDTIPAFKSFAGKSYLRAGVVSTYDPKDLQSFTLSRFMPPELIGYEGKAIVIDPDIFAIKDVSSLFELDMKGCAIACCEKKGHFDTSMMLLDCAKLRHWNIERLLSDLAEKKIDYVFDVMSLKHEPEGSILPIPRIWNNLDILTLDTYFLHTTNRLTQPWKTGLPIDFTVNPLPKLFGIIPREPIHKLLGKYPTKYLPHPDTNIEKFFITLAKDGYKAGVLTKEYLQQEMSANHIRKDTLTLIEEN